MKKLLLLAILAIGVTALAQVPNYVPVNGLIGWYPFSGNVLDSSANGNNGTIVGGATLTKDRNGRQNSAYRLFSANDRIELQTVSTNNILKYSVTGWFQINQGSSNFDGTLFTHSNACNGSNGLRLFIGKDNLLYWKVEFTTGCVGMGTHQSNHNYKDDSSWHFFAVTFDGMSGSIKAFQFKIYIDNILVTKSTDSIGGDGNQSPVVAPITNSTASTSIGNINVGNGPFIGKLDDFGIWNRVLTTKEINDLHTAKTLDVNRIEKVVNISIWPNPANELITVSLNPVLIGSNYSIIDPLGRVVLEGKLNDENSEIKIRELPSQVYYLIVGEANSQIFKLIKY